MAGWSNHLDGAKALIRLRGKDVITESTPEGLEMFQLVRSMSVCDMDPALGSLWIVETLGTHGLRRQTYISQG